MEKKFNFFLTAKNSAMWNLVDSVELRGAAESGDKSLWIHYDE